MGHLETADLASLAGPGTQNDDAVARTWASDDAMDLYWALPDNHGPVNLDELQEELDWDSYGRVVRAANLLLATDEIEIVGDETIRTAPEQPKALF